MNAEKDETYEHMPDWVQIGGEVPALRDAPFKLFFKTFKSSSDEAEAFIHDPRRFSMGQPVAGFDSVEGAVLPGVGEETRIVTVVTNHERTLQRKIIYAVAVVDSDEDKVTYTIYKQEA